MIVTQLNEDIDLQCQHINSVVVQTSIFLLMQLLCSLLISSADPCVSVQEQAEAAPESSITIYKNFLAVCGLSHACREDIIHSLFSAAEETEPFSEGTRNWASFTCSFAS